MKKIIKTITTISLGALLSITLCSCESSNNRMDIEATKNIGNQLVSSQPTPTDLDYSLERYNLQKRSYWVNGQRDKANALECPVEKPISYIVTFLEGVGAVQSYTVDGKVSSLNSFLTPDSEYYSKEVGYNEWLPDIDGSYGTNNSGNFFFTIDGDYVETDLKYIYTDILYEIENPILTVKEK